MKKYLKKYIKSDGFTLIEIIISLAIIGVLMISFITVFTSGFINIMRSGYRADAAYQSQKDMTNNIIQEDGVIETTSITYDFNGMSPIVIEVNIIESSTDINGNTSLMKSFIPTTN